MLIITRINVCLKEHAVLVNFLLTLVKNVLLLVQVQLMQTLTQCTVRLAALVHGSQILVFLNVFLYVRLRIFMQILVAVTNAYQHATKV